MPNDGAISRWRGLPSASAARVAPGRSIAASLAALGLSACTAAPPTPAPAAAPSTVTSVVSHCRADERVQFSCPIGAKLVSLCAAGKPGQPGTIASLSYRYGAPGQVENEFVATPGNNRRFFATVSPARPGASVNQLWFDRGDTRYLLTECVGGHCPQPGGLAVLRGDALLMNARCGASALAWFSRELVRFGADAEGSRSMTELLRIEDADNDLQKIYPGRGAPPK